MSLGLTDGAVSQMNKPQAYRKMIQRERNLRAGYVFQKKHFKLIVFPKNFRFTYKQQHFYCDSGQDDSGQELFSNKYSLCNQHSL